MSDTRQAVPGFADSEIPPRESIMDSEMIRSMIDDDPITDDELQKLLADHKSFLASGGAGGNFMRLEVAGMPLNVYSGSGTEGSHLTLRQKKIAPGTTLNNVDFSYSDLAGSQAEGVNFINCNFNGALITNAFFAGANFEGSTFDGTDLTECDLTNASFKNTDLANADFEIANCEAADFTGANLDGATFKGANLTGVKR